MALTSIKSTENTSIPVAGSNNTTVFSSPQAVDNATVNVKDEPVKPPSAEPVDKVTLQNTIQNEKQQSATIKTVKEENKKNFTPRSINNVLFDYTFKGDLRIQFMDSENQVIYQTPPVLFVRMADIMSRSKSAVNTRA